MQEGHPLAFISKALYPKNQALSTYENELLAIPFAIKQWSHYLQSRHFVIKTDHKSLKYLLEQKRLGTSTRQAWMTKLQLYDYEIQYRKGQENHVAHALSMKPSTSMFAIIVHVMLDQLMTAIKATWQSDPSLKQLIAELQQDFNSHSRYTWQND